MSNGAEPSVLRNGRTAQRARETSGFELFPAADPWSLTSCLTCCPEGYRCLRVTVLGREPPYDGGGWASRNRRAAARRQALASILPRNP